MGFIIKFVLKSTWGDAHYIGLNGIEIFDNNGDTCLFLRKKEFTINADPNSVFIYFEKDLMITFNLID